jgi:hypothetical protein
MTATEETNETATSFVGTDARGHFVHYCHCGAWGSFGVGVSLREGRLGQWYCAEHRSGEDDRKAGSQDVAFENAITEWLNQHHPETSPNRCAHCGKVGGLLLPIGVGPYAWVHDTCLDQWRAARRAQAISALASCGVTVATILNREGEAR